jgi:beta-lactamase class D
MERLRGPARRMVGIAARCIFPIMKRQLCAVVLLSVSLVVASASAQIILDRADLQRRFDSAGVRGAFVVYDLRGDTLTAVNLRRIDSAFLPASTFKIPNSLVALDRGAIRDAEDSIRWDGVERPIAAWNRTHTLRSAIRESVVWFYQELARRVGAARMRRSLRAIPYGNADIGGGIDRFWLDGKLRISARQQAVFLARLHRGTLPFSPRSMDIVKDILVRERGDNYTLRAKTGWAGRVARQIGWWVGSVEFSDGRVYTFALNLDLRDEADLPLREGLARALLRDLRLLPAP